MFFHQRPVFPDSQKHQKILVVRNDGLGDFVLTLPLISALKKALPQAEVHVLVSGVVEQLLPLLPDITGGIVDEGVLLKRHRGRFSAQETLKKRTALLREIQDARFDAAIFSYAEKESAALIHRAKIPIRVGPLRRGFFWRFNRHNTKSRKGSSKSEFELNLESLTSLGFSPAYTTPSLTIPSPERPLPKGEYVVMHPYKRSGTALTWPMERFAAVAQAWAKAGVQVVIVGDQEDTAVLQERFGGTAATGSMGILIETGLSLPGLAALIGNAALFVGNSSGPLHLAGLTKTPHVGFFPQNRVSAPARWQTLPWEQTPKDPADFLLASEFHRNCVGCDAERCPHFNCVASIPSAQLASAIQAWGLNHLAEPLEGLPDSSQPTNN